jgi:alcohol dehydrogenase (NADP+)
MTKSTAHYFAADGINPGSVPYKTTPTGARMPVIGLGTFGSDHYSGESIADAVKGAIEVGYRHIDCAAVYGNEHLVGQSLRDAMQSGVQREALWITSKLWNDKHAENDVIPACEQSLRDLQLDYLDLYLIELRPTHPLPPSHTRLPVKSLSSISHI